MRLFKISWFKETTRRLSCAGILLALVMVLRFSACTTKTIGETMATTEATTTPEVTTPPETTTTTSTPVVVSGRLPVRKVQLGLPGREGTGAIGATGPQSTAGIVTSLTNFSSPTSQTILQMAAGATEAPFVIQDSNGTPVFSVGTNGDVFALTSLKVGHTVTITSNAVTGSGSLLVSAAGGSLTLNSSSNVVYFGANNSVIVPASLSATNIVASNNMSASNGYFNTLAITGTLYVSTIDTPGVVR